MQKMIFYSGVGWWSPRWTGGGLDVERRWRMMEIAIPDTWFFSNS